MDLGLGLVFVLVLGLGLGEGWSEGWGWGLRRCYAVTFYYILELTYDLLLTTRLRVLLAELGLRGAQRRRELRALGLPR